MRNRAAHKLSEEHSVYRRTTRCTATALSDEMSDCIGTLHIGLRFDEDASLRPSTTRTQRAFLGGSVFGHSQRAKCIDLRTRTTDRFPQRMLAGDTHAFDSPRILPRIGPRCLLLTCPQPDDGPRAVACPPRVGHVSVGVPAASACDAGFVDADTWHVMVTRESRHRLRAARHDRILAYRALYRWRPCGSD